MTPKIERFLRDNAPATPCLVLDVDQVEANYLAMRESFPFARIFYALKANPARAVLERLVSLGASFDAASWEEIGFCLQAGATPDRISFGNTIKKASAIRRAHEAGIDLFVFDSPEELQKIAANAPGARVFCRLVVATDGAIFPLARKFGTGTDMALDLMHRCAGLGLVPYGLSFHPGSQQTGPEAHEAAIGQVAMLFDALAHDGIELKMINLGGGFPSRYQDEVAPIEEFGRAVQRALTYHFSNDLPEVLLEPGRHLVGDAGAIEAEVVLVSHRSRTANRSISSNPSQKPGNEIPETASTIPAWSCQRPRRTPESTPIAAPTMVAQSIAAMVSHKVGMKRAPISLATGWRVRLERPSSPCAVWST